MGFTILPICKKCGYNSKSISIGGGKANYQTQCGAPAWNIETNEVEEINLYDEINKTIVKQRFLYLFYRETIIEKMKDKYVPYYETKLFINDKEIESHHWSNKYYKKSKNFCPKCKTFNLDFVKGGICFD